ncbi:TPA: hypothetical protein ACQZK0_000189 [Enterobacter mori]|uniref:hypothetical protein n=1 Tax=Enterobacter mori TaxID=539813 RepID=UPI003D6FCBC2
MTPGLRSANNIAALVKEKQTPLIAAFFLFNDHGIKPGLKDKPLKYQVNEVLLIFLKKFVFLRNTKRMKNKQQVPALPAEISDISPPILALL